MSADAGPVIIEKPNSTTVIVAVETMLAETKLADLRARAAWVRGCACTGCATKGIQLSAQWHFLSGATRALAPTYPCSPCLFLRT